ncbi:MAG TPA: hypothetical protein VFN68_06135 [Acidimicrobiales bacterium]|nr:hypothetical protein [Acidimicrobiales bacterium]
MSTGSGSKETTHRGVRWRREDDGGVSFLDPRSRRWVRWAPGVDSPPLPPRWNLLGVPTRVERPAWRSRWRIIPIVLVLAAVAIAVLQTSFPPSNAVKNEARASAALLGRCLPQTGTAEGHPKYSTKTVPCDSPQAKVKVVRVVPSTPGSPLCPAGTTPLEIPYPGVSHPHVECVQPLR